ncbi:MAG: TIGR04013 family B12-binding domain/radical SAM domain-containing protein [Candidatus Lokiarchaeota archaeon]|nr:TIGR04013 family B12-binding domain/radical SAM domain-containing protein [Candidatus Lokiarchaeota archaeon]
MAFLIYYHKQNFYSLNAIAGALETDDIFESIDFYFVRTIDKLLVTLEEVIKTYDKIVIGISFSSIQLFETYELVQKLKNRFPERFLAVAGGSHPTGDPHGTLKMGFDIVVVGEGEETITELMQKIINNENYSTIKGIAYSNDDNEYIFTGKRNVINLDEYPPFPVKNTRFGAIEITRGCPYVCYFCQTPYILGTSPRHRSIEIICKYVQELKDYFRDHTDIRFITPNAFSYGSIDGKNLNLKKLEDLLINIRKIIGKNGRIFLGTFPSEVRPEHVSNDTLDLVLKYADNDNITIGAQSGSQRILELCHRGHTIEDICKAVDLTLRCDLKINVDFIFGLPGESEEDVKLTIGMMKELSNKGARVHAHSFIPLPQTPFSKAQVTRIKDVYKKEIKSLISKGSAFGDWMKQERLAIKIAEYMKNRKLK